MEKEYIHFRENVSSYYIYSSVMAELKEYVSKESLPVFDFTYTRHIDTNAVPVLLSLCTYLKRYFKKPVYFEFVSGSYIFLHLSRIRFLEIGKENDILDYDESLFVEALFEQNTSSYVVCVKKAKSYPAFKNIDDFSNLKNSVLDALYDKYKYMYRSELEKSGLGDAIVQMTLTSVVELSTNAMIHSESDSFVYVSSDQFNTCVSVSDVGVGLRTLEDKRKKGTLILYDNYKDKLGDKFSDYLYIMSALDYSYRKHAETDRPDDLWTVKYMATSFDGEFKMKYHGTQVVFTSSRCKGCDKWKREKNLSCCVECLYNDYSDTVYSPIKGYAVGIQGVSTEIRFGRRI